MNLDQIDHVALTVTNMERSIAWYQVVLGLERRHAAVWGNHPAALCAGETCVALFAADTPDPKPQPDHNTLAMRHLAFRVNRAHFEEAQKELAARGVEFEFEDHTISHSIYLSDPDGHRIEITTYELALPQKDSDRR
jgi:catechol 2,3-dioxygenase-like lactoylglutathione lyase family enzyme